MQDLIIATYLLPLYFQLWYNSSNWDLLFIYCHVIHRISCNVFVCQIPKITIQKMLVFTRKQMYMKISLVFPRLLEGIQIFFIGWLCCNKGGQGSFRHCPSFTTGSTRLGLCERRQQSPEYNCKEIRKRTNKPERPTVCTVFLNIQIA